MIRHVYKNHQNRQLCLHWESIKPYIYSTFYLPESIQFRLSHPLLKFLLDHPFDAIAGFLPLVSSTPRFPIQWVSPSKLLSQSWHYLSLWSNLYALFGNTCQDGIPSEVCLKLWCSKVLFIGLLSVSLEALPIHTIQTTSSPRISQDPRWPHDRHGITYPSVGCILKTCG